MKRPTRRVAAVCRPLLPADRGSLAPSRFLICARRSLTSTVKVRLRVMFRRFVCEATLCQQRILAERFEDNVVAERSRRTARLECLAHHPGLALAGRSAAGFAKRRMVSISNDTLLRVVRRRASPREHSLDVVGIDDCA